MEATQMAINKWSGLENVAYTFNGILFCLKTETDALTWYSVDKPWGHFNKAHKPQSTDTI